MEKYTDCGKKLGKGNFSSVRLVERKSDHKLLAMKMIDVDTNTGGLTEAVHNETAILKKLHHPNIVEFFEAFVNEDHLCIVMEYCDQGDLQQKIKETQKQGMYFTEEKILGWFTQICLAVQYLHDNRIIHRDIKVHNTFLTSQGIIKLGDFGISKQLEQTGDLASTQTGTPFYLTPEMCLQSTSSHKSDIWMLGCILHELCSLEKPFSGDNIPNVIHKIMQEKHASAPEHFTTLVHDLIDKLLEKDPNKRPSIENILSIPEISQEVIKLKTKYPHIYSENSIRAVIQEKDSLETKTDVQEDLLQTKPRSISSGAYLQGNSSKIETNIKLGSGMDEVIIPQTQGRTSSKSTAFAYKQIQLDPLDEEGKVDTNNKIFDIASKLSPNSSRQSPNATKRKANNIHALIEQKRAKEPINTDKTTAVHKGPTIGTPKDVKELVIEGHGKSMSEYKSPIKVIPATIIEKKSTHGRLTESSRKNQKLSINIPEISDNTTNASSQPGSKGEKPLSSGIIKSSIHPRTTQNVYSYQDPLKVKKKPSFSDQVFDPLSPGSPNRPFFTIQFLKIQLGEEKYEKVWEQIEKHEDPKKLLNEDSHLITQIIGQENKHLLKMIGYLIYKKNDVIGGQGGKINFNPSQTFKSPASATSIFKNSFITDTSIDAGREDTPYSRRNPWYLSKSRMKAEVPQNILTDEATQNNDLIKDGK